MNTDEDFLDDEDDDYPLHDDCVACGTDYYLEGEDDDL